MLGLVKRSYNIAIEVMDFPEDNTGIVYYLGDGEYCIIISEKWSFQKRRKVVAREMERIAYYLPQISYMIPCALSSFNEGVQPVLFAIN